MQNNSKLGLYHSKRGGKGKGEQDSKESKLVYYN
jgi:hypothetical protein